MHAGKNRLHLNNWSGLNFRTLKTLPSYTFLTSTFSQPLYHVIVEILIATAGLTTVQATSPARCHSASRIELVAHRCWGSSESKTEQKGVEISIHVHSLISNEVNFMKSCSGKIPGPGSSQQRCFEARRMTDGRCTQIRPSPSAKGPRQLTRLLHHRPPNLTSSSKMMDCAKHTLKQVLT